MLHSTLDCDSSGVLPYFTQVILAFQTQVRVTAKWSGRRGELVSITTRSLTHWWYIALSSDLARGGDAEHEPQGRLKWFRGEVIVSRRRGSDPICVKLTGFYARNRCKVLRRFRRLSLRADLRQRVSIFSDMRRSCSSELRLRDQRRAYRRTTR